MSSENKDRDDTLIPDGVYFGRDESGFYVIRQQDGKTTDCVVLTPLQLDALNSFAKRVPTSGVVAEQAALESAMKFIETDVAGRRCDSPDVSNCVRCNATYLSRQARCMIAAIAAAREQSRIDAERIRELGALLAECHYVLQHETLCRSRDTNYATDCNCWAAEINQRIAAALARGEGRTT